MPKKSTTEYYLWVTQASNPTEIAARIASVPDGLQAEVRELTLLWWQQVQRINKMRGKR